MTNPFANFVNVFRPTRPVAVATEPEAPAVLVGDAVEHAYQEVVADLIEKAARCLCYHNPSSPSWTDIDEEVREEYRSMAFGILFKLKDFKG